jgi:mono/diheme cytochrome c family protein
VHDIEAIVRGVSGGVGAALWSYVANNECRLIYDGSAPPIGSNAAPCYGAKPTTDLNNVLNGSLANLDRSDTNMPCLPTDTSCNAIGLLDWPKIDAYLRSERAPQAPTGLVADDVAAGLTVFRGANCAGCHGGPGWTVSRLFYQPGDGPNGVLPYKPPSEMPQLGTLRTQTYAPPPELLALNPPAMLGLGSASLRNSSSAIGADLITYLYSSANESDDQIRCTLRDVGTFPQQGQAPNFLGISAQGAPPVLEQRSDMKTLAQGQMGFNPPSLFGLSLGAPYFHAGNARSLEEIFNSDAFSRHFQALAPTGEYLTPSGVAHLVSFLLSIDEGTDIEPLPSPPAGAAPPYYDFCPQTL